MTPVFADTFYFLAFVNPRDAAHQREMDFSKNSSAPMLTTTWVLTEVADGLANTPNRHLFRAILEDLEHSSADVIVWPDESLFRRGANLYDSRPDKEWSLTDCISFVVMQDQGILEALTGDHHFEQAGFTALLK
jgi:predicted nucleic acid-binding protein